MKSKIVVVGSINCDININVAALPQRNETVMGQKSALKLGGKGLNQAVAAARAGADVTMVACVGRDAFGESAKAYLVDNHVDIRHVYSSEDLATGTASIFVDDNAHNMIVVAPEANTQLSPGLVALAEAEIAAADVVVVQMEVPLESIRKTLELARKHSVLSILNPAPANTSVLDILYLADIITPNESETELLSGLYPHDTKSSLKAAKLLQQAGAHCVVITRGSDGCDYLLDDKIKHIEPFSITAVDPTGAGDVFNGALACSLATSTLTQSSLDDAIVRASAAAAMSVTKPYAQNAAPFCEEIDAFITQNKRQAQLA
ncbi:MAG: ribokinase [Flavobacteriales bacterium]